MKYPRFMRRHALLSALGIAFMVIFIPFLILGLILGPGVNKEIKLEKNKLKDDLTSYVKRLNDPSLGNAAYTLDNDHLVSLLNEAGAIWKLEMLEGNPKHCNIIGEVPGWSWGELHMDQKNNLLKGITVCVYDITKDKDWLKVTIKDRSSGEVLAKRDMWSLKIYR